MYLYEYKSRRKNGRKEKIQLFQLFTYLRKMFLYDLYGADTEKNVTSC